MGLLNMNKGKKEKVVEPEYYYSATKILVSNYKVCYLSKKEKIFYFLLAFIVGGAVGYLFYGGIGLSELGNRPTTTTYICNFIAVVLTGFIAGKLILPVVVANKKEKRQKALAKQFRDMLDTITTSIGAGKNIPEAFLTARNDLAVQYSEDSDIVHEIDVINDGIRNSVLIEDLLEDFGERSGIDDIKSFANVFKICYKKGGNIKDVIRNTHSILSDKMTIKEEIETLVTANKFEQNIMIVMPVALIALIKFSSPDFAANFTTTTGIISTTIAVALFVISYFIGRKILKIKV